MDFSGKMGLFISCDAPHPLLCSVSVVVVQRVEGVFHAGESSAQRQQQVNDLLQVSDEHEVLLSLVGFAALLN